MGQGVRRTHGVAGRRIVAHTLSYPPWRHIGAELATHGLMRYLADAGWTAIAVPHKHDVSPHCRDGVHVIPPSMARAVRADVVLAHVTYVAQAREHADASSAPLIVSGHGGAPGWLATQARQGSPDLVFANSQHMRTSLLRISPDVHVLRPPVEPPARIPTRFGKAIGLVNASREKGGQVLAALAERMPDQRFVVIEGGYGKQVNFSRHSNVVVLPHGTPMASFWSEVKVLIVPSREESWGMVAVEAMHRGIPVLASTAVGLVECLAGQQQVLPVDDVPLWQERLQALTRNAAFWKAWHTLALRRSAELDPAYELRQTERLIGRQIGVEIPETTRRFRNVRTGQIVDVEIGSHMDRRLTGKPLVWHVITEGAVATVGDDADVRPELPETTAAVSGTLTVSEVSPPAANATLAEWVDYAVNRGADRAAAKSATRATLIALYGDVR